MGDVYAEFLTRWIEHDTPATTMQQGLLKRALHFYERILTQPPVTERQRVLAAQAHGRVGQIHRFLGNHAEAADAFQNSIALGVVLAADRPDDRQHHRELVWDSGQPLASVTFEPMPAKPPASASFPAIDLLMADIGDPSLNQGSKWLTLSLDAALDGLLAAI